MRDGAMEAIPDALAVNGREMPAAMPLTDGYRSVSSLRGNKRFVCGRSGGLSGKMIECQHEVKS